jgi:molecular chaperone GrpE
LFERNDETIEKDNPESIDAKEIADVDEQKELAEKYLSNWQRSEADFSNYRKRAEQEKMEIISRANKGLILSVLPALDDIERALDALTPKQAHLDWAEGFKLIQKKLQTILESQGLTEIDALGKPFDPTFHEAIAHLAGEEGLVLNVMQKGYMLKGDVLRPSLVSVGNGVNDSANNPDNKD